MDRGRRRGARESRLFCHEITGLGRRASGGAKGGTRTLTGVAHWNLNPARLPVPPLSPARRGRRDSIGKSIHGRGRAGPAARGARPAGRPRGRPSGRTSPGPAAAPASGASTRKSRAFGAASRLRAPGGRCQSLAGREVTRSRPVGTGIASIPAHEQQGSDDRRNARAPRLADAYRHPRTARLEPTVGPRVARLLPEGQVFPHSLPGTRSPRPGGAF